MAACGEVELCSRLIAAIEAGITGTGRLRPGVRLVPDHMVLEIFGASGFGYIAPEEACRLATWPPAALLAAAPRAWTACLVEAWQGAEETRQAWVGELPSQAGVSCDKPGSPIVRDERRHAELLSLARRSGECLVQIFKSSLHHCGQPAARHLNKMAAAVVGTLLQGCRSPLSGSLARLALRAGREFTCSAARSVPLPRARMRARTSRRPPCQTTTTMMDRVQTSDRIVELAAVATSHLRRPRPRMAGTFSE